MRTLFFSPWSAPREQHTHQEVTEHYQVSIITQCTTSFDNSKHTNLRSFLFYSYAYLLHWVQLDSLHHSQGTQYFMQTKQNSFFPEFVSGMLINLLPLSNLDTTERCPHLTPVVLLDSKFTINIHIKIKKMEKNNQLSSQVNTLHSSKMYNAAICEWQHQT